jgi:hypothetical protein
MRGAIPPLPNPPSWRGAQLKYMVMHNESALLFIAGIHNRPAPISITDNP